jgi:hypothetical protein
MARTNPQAGTAAASPESFVECLRYFLTPQVWKQVHQALDRHGGRRWLPQSLIFVALTMTWCWGESEAERFETARVFYVACYQKRRRPGQTIEGLQKALARVPLAALRVVAQGVRARLQQVFSDRLRVDGFIPIGCDGSRLACPRSQELEQRLGMSGRDGNFPQVWVTAFVHLSTGLLWAWRLGKGRASERDHLVQLLSSLPRSALLVADAGYVGYALLQTLLRRRIAFLIRLSSSARLCPEKPQPRSCWRDGRAYYWPQWAEKDQLPLRVRVLCIRGRKSDVWLMTNVFDPRQLSLRSASRFYRWRWRNEGLFRTYKRTLGKVKLMSRTVAMVHREAESSLLAVQLLLAQGVLTLPDRCQARSAVPSARQVLLTIRGEIRNQTGMYLGPRQQLTYRQRLRRARLDLRRRRWSKIRRPWPGRAEHRPPRPPRILKMGSATKERLAKRLEQAKAG